MPKIIIVLRDYFLSITFVSQLLPDPVSVCLISVIVIVAVNINLQCNSKGTVHKNRCYSFYLLRYLYM